MKISLLVSVAALVHQSICNEPNLGWDQNTTADCITWYDNDFQQTCEEVRDDWNITPEIFHKWNPSVGLDCKPWEYQSYCVASQERFNEWMATYLFSSKVAATPTLAPSPTDRTSLGCYAEGGYYPLIVSPAGGDSALTIPGCRNICYSRYYGFAAVKEGNQCWCSDYVSGELMDNQEDCNIPCAGDKKTSCGGKGVLSFFKTE
ncbi:hypothetical protein VF21_10606 [Pseudogymnoascus sp. 05NY08]|nr:hypothetical protein VF21_10606 [Pseudogymnoascus sp. 05NY08]